MYTVLVVDDEPVALRHLCMLIERYQPDFAVSGQAGNAPEALAKADVLRPDLVLSDIKMPGMDGIDLIGKIHEKHPETLFLLVSGYQDFEYAKKAIRIGACDYLLKPVTPSAFNQTMSIVAQRLHERFNQRRNQIIKKIIMGACPALPELNKYFFYPDYHIALIRKNGLPRRFQGKADLELFSADNDQMTVYGRDENESLYICPRAFKEKPLFLQKIQELVKRESEGGYVTAIVCENSVALNEISGTIPKLYRELDRSIVLGLNQTLALCRRPRTADSAVRDNADDILQIMLWIRERKYASVTSEIRRLLRKWNRQHCTELWVERQVSEIVHAIAKNEGIDMMEAVDGTPFIFMLEDAFFYATNAGELTESVECIIRQLWGEDEAPADFGSPAFFDALCEYMKNNIDQPVNIQSVCKAFNICQPYLSRIFRRNTGQSFNRFLTSLRIERAKTLMKKHPDALIKDIALMVGYADPFYFSRIFRSVTGGTPTNYMESCAESRENQLCEGGP